MIKEVRMTIEVTKLGLRRQKQTLIYLLDNTIPKFDSAEKVGDEVAMAVHGLFEQRVTDD